MCSYSSNNESKSPSSNKEEGLPLYENSMQTGCTHIERGQSPNSDNEPVQKSTVVGRFAPTPSGKLHLGNAFSFLMAYLVARQAGGSVLMRIEDLDPARSKQSYADGVFRCLDALGFEWDNEPVYQSSRTEAYFEAYQVLDHKGLLYPCFCTRSDLHSANAPHFGEEVLYQGTCRTLSKIEREEKAKLRNPATRIVVPTEQLAFNDLFQGPQSFNLAESSGDFIVQRSDGVYAYQLAVTVDDAWMGVTSIVRGSDLITSTPRQMYLQKCLGYTTPTYGHVPLLVDSEGRRLSKRSQSTDIDYLLNEKCLKPEYLLGKIAYTAGIVDEMRSYPLVELIRYANLNMLYSRKVLRVPDCLDR